MLKQFMSFFILVGMGTGLPCGLRAQGKPKPAENARSYKDYPVQSYPAQLRTDFLEENLSKLPRTLDCANFEVLSQLQSIIPKETDSRTAYVLHVAKWETQGGSYALNASHWYVFRALRTRSVDGTLGCSFVNTGFSAAGSPLIYADKNVWLIGIDYFDGKIEPGAVSLGYKLGNLPQTPENVQNFGALVAGVLGATLPGAVGGVGAEYAFQVEANKARRVPGYVTVAKFDFMKRFPQSLTFSFSLTVNNVGGLPPARIGMPYSASVSASGGSGVYKYSIVPTPEGNPGVLPSGIGLDPNTGTISGTPTAGEPGKYIFSVKASDTSKPPNETIVNAFIDLSSSIFVQAIPVTPAAVSLRFPDAKIDVPYSAIIVPNITGVTGTKYTFSVDTSHAKWAQFDAKTNLISGTPCSGSEKPCSVDPARKNGDGGPAELKINVLDRSNPGKPVAVVTAMLQVWPVPGGAGANPSAIALPDAEPGKAYHSGLAIASLSNATLTESGDFPKGITFNPTSGEISGIAMDPSDNGKTFVFGVQLASSSTGGNNSTSASGDFLFSIKVANPVAAVHNPDDDYDAVIDFSSNPKKFTVPLTSSANVGQRYSASLKITGIDGKYLILAPCKHGRGVDAEEPAFCRAREWFDLPPAFRLETNARGQQNLVLISSDGSEAPAGQSLDLEAIPWAAGKTDLALEFCKERDKSNDEANADKSKQLNYGFSENDCNTNAIAELIGLVDVQPPPLQALTVSLTTGSSTGPSGPSTHGGQSQSPGGNGPSNNSPAAAAPKTGSQNGPGSSGKNTGGSSGAPTPSTVLNPQSVDCSVVNSQSPCTFSDTFANMDREAIDFSIGVSVPGVRELKYASASAAPTKTTHTDLYALVDFYPLAVIQHFTDWSKVAYMPSKESWFPHFNFGIPVTSQPFYRPYVGLSENLTAWTGAESHGFPLRINFFAGFVDMKQQILVTQPGGEVILKHDRTLKPMFGIEVPISSIVSKISGGKSQSSKGSSAGGASKN